jgi:hypothetical protein
MKTTFSLFLLIFTLSVFSQSFLDIDFGENYIVESDIYLFNIETKETCRLTDSKKHIKVYPSWSQNKMTCVDEKTRIVYIGDIVPR